LSRADRGGCGTWCVPAIVRHLEFFRREVPKELRYSRTDGRTVIGTTARCRRQIRAR
jgi:hypothetical protein